MAWLVLIMRSASKEKAGTIFAIFIQQFSPENCGITTILPEIFAKFEREKNMDSVQSAVAGDQQNFPFYFWPFTGIFAIPPSFQRGAKKQRNTSVIWNRFYENTKLEGQRSKLQIWQGWLLVTFSGNYFFCSLGSGQAIVLISVFTLLCNKPTH